HRALHSFPTRRSSDLWLSAMICEYSGLAYAPVITMTSAVMVQTMTVSMNGSSSATMPSRAGYGVRAAECAIAAEPAPASLENARSEEHTSELQSRENL